MSVVFILVFAAIVMAGAFLIAFIWSVKNGQYDDTYTPSVRILFDDPPINTEETEKVKGESLSGQSQLANSTDKNLEI